MLEFFYFVWLLFVRLLILDLKIFDIMMNTLLKYSSCYERGTKNKSESPTGMEPMASQTPGGRSNH